MNTIRKILFPLISLFLGYRSVELITGLLRFDNIPNGAGELFLLAFLLSLFITGIFAFAGFAWPTNRLLPQDFYRIQNPGKLKKIYRIFGVEFFRKALLIFFWGHKKNRKKYFNGTRKGLRNFAYQSQQSEFGHLASFVSIFLVSLPLLLKEMFILVGFLTLINVIGNLFPVILQRYHRLRIEKIESRLVNPGN